MEPGKLTGPRLVAQHQAVREQIARCLRGFAAPSEDRPGLNTPRFKVEVPSGDPLYPWAIRFFVVDVIGGHDVGRAERLAWAAPMEVDGVLIWFAHAKFGVSATVYGVDTSEAAASLVADCMKRMGKAAPVVHRHLIEPLIKDAVAHGAFTVPNKFNFFFGMYSHLRSLSESSASRAKQADPISETFPNGSSTRFIAAEIAHEAEYEAIGALFAFFSLLEQLLVIGLAFGEFDPAAEPFSRFIGLNWADKFKRVVGLDRSEDKSIYDMLKALADENRNPAAHGGVDRGIANIHVHLHGYGAVPTSVNSDSTRSRYTFEPRLPRAVHPFADYHFFGASADGWEAVDTVLAWMKTGPLQGAYIYGESGLPMWFDRRSREELRDVIAAENLDEFLVRRSYLIDQASNMDW